MRIRKKQKVCERHGPHARTDDIALVSYDELGGTLLAAELLPWPIKVRLLQLFPRASAAGEVWTPKFSGGDGLELGARESGSVEC